MMNNWIKLTALGALACAHVAATAQDDEQAQRAATQQELAAAQARLEAAAREVAELSQAMAGDILVMDGNGFAFATRPLLGLTLDAGANPVFVNGQRVGGNDTDAAADGVLISGVNQRSGAGRAGIEAGDRLLSVDGVSLVGEAASKGLPLGLISEALADRKPGDTVAVEVLRDGKRMSKQVELTQAPMDSQISSFRFSTGEDDMPRIDEHFVIADGAGHAQNFETMVFDGGMFGGFAAQRRWADMELVELSRDLGEYFGADTGLLVVRAPSDEAIGFRDGDVIRRIGDRTPETVGHAMRILRSYEPGESLQVDILRDRKPRTLNVTLPE
ncbi:MAG: PDZ domain-containing protein [Pseudomonadota bacterium]